MNSLIIGACFVVALLAIVGLVFALREPSTPVVTTREDSSHKTPATSASAPIRAEAKTTQQLPDHSMPTAEIHPSEQPTTLLTSPSSGFIDDADQTQEHTDSDELDYAELSTIRSLPSNHYEETRSEASRVTYEHLQTIANELHDLHSQMKNMEQRINVLTDQVQYLRGNDEPSTKWDVSRSALKVPVQ